VISSFLSLIGQSSHQNLLFNENLTIFLILTSYLIGVLDEMCYASECQEKPIFKQSLDLIHFDYLKVLCPI
jgi:hypothetical protein